MSAAVEAWVTELIGAISQLRAERSLTAAQRLNAALAVRPFEGVPTAWQDVAAEAEAYLARANRQLPAFEPGPRYFAALSAPIPTHHAWQDRKDVA